MTKAVWCETHDSSYFYCDWVRRYERRENCIKGERIVLPTDTRTIDICDVHSAVMETALLCEAALEWNEQERRRWPCVSTTAVIMGGDE